MAGMGSGPRLGPGSGINRPCRYTDDRRGWRDILGNYGTSAHHRPIADMQPRKHDAPERKKNTFTDRRATAEVRNRDMGIVADVAVMVDARFGVQDDVSTDAGAGLDDATGKHNAARAEGHIRMDRREWMHRGCPLDLDLVADAFAHVIVPDPDNGARAGGITHRRDRPADGNAQNVVPPILGRVVEERIDLPAHRMQSCDDHRRVPPGTENRDALLSHGETLRAP